MNWKMLAGVALLSAGVAWGQIGSVWQSGDITGDSDVVTEGELLAAYAVSAATEVNGVAFAKPTAYNTNACAWGTMFTMDMGYYGTRSLNTARGTPTNPELSNAYITLLKGMTYASNSQSDLLSPLGRVTIQNLKPGAVYLVQIWSSDSSEWSTTNRLTTFTASSTISPSVSVTVRHNLTAAKGGTGQYVVLRFTATAEQHMIEMSAPDFANSVEAIALSAIQLRKLADSTEGVSAWQQELNEAEWDVTDRNWGGDGETVLWSAEAGAGRAGVMAVSGTTDGLITVNSDVTAGTIYASGGFQTLQGTGSLKVSQINSAGVLSIQVPLMGDSLLKDDAGSLFFLKSDVPHQTKRITVDNGSVILGGLPSFWENSVFRLDASMPDSIVRDANGAISSWKSVGDVTLSYDFTEAMDADFVKPVYDANAFGGKGGVVFGANGPSKLLSSLPVTVRTVFAVMHFDTFADYSEVWGINGLDNNTVRGIRLAGSTTATSAKWYQDASNTGNFNETDCFWVDGVASTTYPEASLTELQVVTATSRVRNDSVDKLFGLGSYSFLPANRTGRYLQGRIAEVVGFSRDLTRSERIAVEEYLRTKWQQPVTRHNLLPIDTKITLEEKGVLQLSNVPQELAQLSGNGSVVASEPVNALIVNAVEDHAYAGTIAANVRVEKKGPALWQLSGDKTFHGILAIQEGTVMAGIDCSLPEDGLAYRIDASRSSTLTHDEEGKVSAWRDARPDSSVVFRQENAEAQPIYTPTAFGGIGGVRFGTDGRVTSLINSQSASIKTVFIVAWTEKANIEFAGIWGSAGANLGLRAAGLVIHNSKSTQWAFNLFNSADFIEGPTKGLFRSNGVTLTSTPTIPLGQPQLIMLKRDATATFPGTAIGKYWDATPTRQYTGYIGEILAYDRDFTEEEYEAVEQALMMKWGLVEQKLTQCFAPEASLEIATGGTLHLAGTEQKVTNYKGAGAIINGELIVTGTVTPTGAVEIFNIPAELAVISPNGNLKISADGDLSTMIITIDKDKLVLGARYSIITCNGELTGLPVVFGVNPEVWMVRRVGDAIELYSIAPTVLELF